MKKTNYLFLIAVALLLFNVSIHATPSSNIHVSEVTEKSELHKRLESLDNVVSIEKLDTELFSERYVIKLKQPLDHNATEKGYFTQRVVISHENYTDPVVMVCEGYGGSYGLNPNYRDEISKKLNTNQVLVEHRYFLESTPEPCDWQYMTGKNAADDLHVITTLLKKLYTGKWISTGISKGGQNTMIYRTYYPNDVDISVPYVGPVCFGVEDGRHEPFIDQCGNEEDRERILEFQKEVLRRKESINPMLYELAEKEKWAFRIPKEEVLDYCVLEFSFSIWQWGTPTSQIPSNDSSDKELFDYLMKIASGSYFGVHSTEPFFVQAAADLGYYGYDIKPFKGLLTVEDAKGYLSRAFLPADAKNISFNKGLSKDIKKFLKRNDPKMIFIYGEFDPWSAAMPDEKLFKNKQNMKLYIEKGGSHIARIGTMPKDVQEEIWATLEKWLKE